MKSLIAFVLIAVIVVLVQPSSGWASENDVVVLNKDLLPQLQGKWEGWRARGNSPVESSLEIILNDDGESFRGKLVNFGTPRGTVEYQFSRAVIENGILLIQWEDDKGNPIEGRWYRLSLSPSLRGKMRLEGKTMWENSPLEGRASFTK